MVLPSSRMAELRACLGALLVATVIVACGSSSLAPAATADDPDAEPPPVPDPPPRYAKIQSTDASTADPDGAAALEIRCGREKPYVCPLEDGAFACSPIPCLPDCTRIGCVGGEVCTACDGGHRCVDPASGC